MLHVMRAPGLMWIHVYAGSMRWDLHMACAAIGDLPDPESAEEPFVRTGFLVPYLRFPLTSPTVADDGWPREIRFDHVIEDSEAVSEEALDLALPWLARLSTLAGWCDFKDRYQWGGGTTAQPRSHAAIGWWLLGDSERMDADLRILEGYVDDRLRLGRPERLINLGKSDRPFPLADLCRLLRSRTPSSYGLPPPSGWEPPPLRLHKSALKRLRGERDE